MGEGFVDLGFARVDTDRQRRCGFPEVVYGDGKTPEEVLGIGRAIVAQSGLLLVTRAREEHFRVLESEFPEARWHARGRCITIEREPSAKLDGTVAVVCAGTSDLPVAEEAAITLEMFGSRVERISDVGVAGIHRLLAVRDRIQACEAVIVVAGMEGALPSVMAGLISKPIIAVPTSVGYGASFGGLSALLGMLNSCGSGVTVVNIDNGFGAACAAAAILRLVTASRRG